YNLGKKEVALELDRRLVTQARALASMRLTSVNYEPVHAASAIAGLSLFGMGALPPGRGVHLIDMPFQSLMDMPAWMRPKVKGTPPKVSDDKTKATSPI